VILQQQGNFLLTKKKWNFISPSQKKKKKSVVVLSSIIHFGKGDKQEVYKNGQRLLVHLRNEVSKRKEAQVDFFMYKSALVLSFFFSSLSTFQLPLHTHTSSYTLTLTSTHSTLTFYT